jgi:hypothetical protein
MFSCKDVTEHASDHLEGALPWRVALQLRVHLLICEHCRRLLRQMRAVSGALGLLGVGAATTRRRPAQRWTELAVGALAGAAVVLAVWLLPSFTGLERQVYAHAIDRHAQPGPTLPSAQVAIKLAVVGARLNGELPGVVFADRCDFFGVAITHLIVQTSTGAVAVMLLPEHAKAQKFTRGGRVGRIEAFGNGTLALLGPDAGSVDEAVARVRAAVDWPA